MTIDPKIIKTVLSTKFRDYSLDNERKQALNSLLGKGIFSSDGEAWSHSRALLRPQFARAQLIDLSMLERHVMKLIELIPHSSEKKVEEVELQELLFRFTMDTATEFLFGQSTDCLTRKQANTENKSSKRGERNDDQMREFTESIQQAQDRIFLHVALGKLAVLTPNRTFQWHVRRVHDFIDGYVHKALAEHNDSTRNHSEPHDEPSQKKKQPYIFLRALVQDTQDPKQIRDELLNILIAGRDTTASLISNVFLMLSKHPEIWSRLRDEVSFLQRQPPTFDQLQQCKLLRFTINESRLYLSPSPQAREINTLIKLFSTSSVSASSCEFSSRKL